MQVDRRAVAHRFVDGVLVAAAAGDDADFGQPRPVENRPGPVGA
ncbi:hypothetical protein [Streptomyces sp. I6]